MLTRNGRPRDEAGKYHCSCQRFGTITVLRAMFAEEAKSIKRHWVDRYFAGDHLLIKYVRPSQTASSHS